MTVFPQSWPCHVMSLCHVSLCPEWVPSVMVLSCYVSICLVSLCHDCVSSVMTLSRYVSICHVSLCHDCVSSVMTLSHYVPMSRYVGWHPVSCYVMRYVLGPISHLGHDPIIPIPLLRVPRPIPWVWSSLPLLCMHIAPDLVPNGTLFHT